MRGRLPASALLSGATSTKPISVAAPFLAWVRGRCLAAGIAGSNPPFEWISVVNGVPVLM